MIRLGIGLDRWRCYRIRRGGLQPVIPDWFNKSIVHWYDIKKQGATNEELTKTKQLKDFSGYDRHLDLIGVDNFTENEGIDSTGSFLKFNGNLYGMHKRKADDTKDAILTDYTVMVKRATRESFGTVSSKSISNAETDGAFVFETWEMRANYSFGSPTYVDNITDLITYQNKNSYNGQKLNVGTAKDTDTLFIGTIRPGSANWKGDLYQYLLFNRTLTDEEMDWVRKNIFDEGDYFLFDNGDEILFDNGEIVTLP